MTQTTDQTTRDTTGAGQVDVQMLHDQIAALKADLAQISRTLAELTRQQGQSAMNDARAKAEAMRDKGAEQVEALRAKADEAMEQADAFVRDRPGAAVGIAAALGFVLGLLTARR